MADFQGGDQPKPVPPDGGPPTPDIYGALLDLSAHLAALEALFKLRGGTIASLRERIEVLEQREYVISWKGKQ